jgi:hypothetical protein
MPENLFFCSLVTEYFEQYLPNGFKVRKKKGMKEDLINMYVGKV